MLPKSVLLSVAACGLLVAFRSVANEPPTHRKLIEASTSKDKGFFHVVCTETITSKQQRDWKDSYAATVEVFKGGKSIGKFRGSTLPNFVPSKDRPKEWKYSVVQATCAFPTDLKERYYTWTRTKRADGKRPCLRLAKQVPTVNLSSVRAAEMTQKELLSMLGEESKASRYAQFAEQILVHSGQSQDWRGSAGCLTIHPDDADMFFALIGEGIDGTLALNRGIEDEKSQSSYCY